ncbi:MAG: hypothetical protein EOO03_05555 [Chitinophagaceae bacterium]|nr:MAG: hypothetical protein EOO03_05555 [Chitinophagaceae bacterium]
MFSHRHRYLFILALSLVTYLSTVLCEVYEYFNIVTSWYIAFTTITAVSFIAWEGSRLLEGLFTKKLLQSDSKIKWLLLFFAAGTTITSIGTITSVFVISMGLHQHTVEEALVPLKLNLIYGWLATLLFHLLHAIVYYFTEYKIKLTEAEELKRVSAQAELQLVKSQINPHFLFNNLNVLSTLVLKNNNEANRFIEAFSKVYRYILSTHENELVDVKTELNYINPYIFLLQKRFPEGLIISINIQEQSEHKFIIPAAIQMLIENAIKHNVVSRSRPLYITVQDSGNNAIVVSNNLQPRETIEHSTQIGLTNIKKRYLLVSGKEVLIDRQMNEFKVELPLLVLN